MRTLTATLLLLGITSSLFGQWTNIFDEMAGQVQTVHFHSIDTGHVAGSFWDAIYKTEDGGSNWDSIAPGYKSWINDIVFVDENTGFAAGGFYFILPDAPGNLILRTDDGGLNWNAIHYSSYGGEFHDIEIADANTAYFVGFREIVKLEISSNTLDTLNALGEFLACSFANTDKGFVINRRHFSGNTYEDVLRTTDGGLSWDTVFTSNGLGGNLGDVYCLNGDTTWLGGSNSCLISTYDGGNSWQVDSLPLSINLHFHRILFTDKHNGFIAATSGTSGYFLQTLDGGQSWQEEYIDTNLWVRDLDILSSGYALVTSFQGVYKKAISFGTGINNQPEPSPFNVYPNPTSDEIIIEVPELSETTELCVYELSGRLIDEVSLTRGTNSINLGHLSSGTYCLVLNHNGKRPSTFKVNVQ